MLGDIGNVQDIINSGKAYCLVGGGASCEMGVPSWRVLAQRMKEELEKCLDEKDQRWVQQKWEDEDYPLVFETAYQTLGEAKVIRFLRTSMRPTKSSGRIYQIISNWPFKVYLTTNFDGLLKRHLEKTGIFFSVKSNTEQDIRTVTDDARNIVVELHGSLSHPETLVLTQSHYRQFLHSSLREYFRRKIRTIFDQYNVIIIGYSLKDPDISFFMDEAKMYSSPEKPFYMFLADAPGPEIKTLYEDKNVRVIPYSTADGGHQQLVHILEMIDSFVVPRRREPVRREKEDIDVATSLYLHTKMQLENENREFGRDAYAILVLNSLWKLPRRRSNSAKEVVKHFPLKAITFANHDSELFEQAIKVLEAKELITVTIEGNNRVLTLTPKGVEKLQDSKAEFENSEEQFEGQIKVDHSSKFPTATPDQKDLFVALLKESLVQFFKQRGLALTSAILGGHPVSVAADKGVFKIFKAYASQLDEAKEQVYFLRKAADLLGDPSDIQKEYLSILSQRYFIYHALNLDPKCQAFRLDYLRRTVWIMDSSVILPLIAKNCENHSCAVDLFGRILDLEILVFTTRGLFQEVISHANWVRSFMDKAPSDIEFLRAVCEEGEYRENLFLKGYINTAVEVGLKGFRDYFNEIFPADDYKACVTNHLEKYGISVIEFHEWPGFIKTDWGEVPDGATAIGRKRQELGTYKSDNQCRREAIVVNILRNERAGEYDILSLKSPKEAYFISQSGVVNVLKEPSEKTFTWSPESFYRYLLTFPGSRETVDNFYECMIASLSLAGLLVINKERYAQYFGDLIQQSKLETPKIVEQYKETLGETQAMRKSQWFARTPDLKKPLFAHQLSLEVAESERERRIVAERMAAEARKTKKLAEGERIELERYRAKAELKRKKVQAKKGRKRKKRKKRSRR